MKSIAAGGFGPVFNPVAHGWGWACSRRRRRTRALVKPDRRHLVVALGGQGSGGGRAMEELLRDGEEEKAKGDLASMMVSQKNRRAVEAHVGDGLWQAGPVQSLAPLRGGSCMKENSRLKITPNLFLRARKIDRNWEKFSKKSCKKKMSFGTTFVIVTSFDSPRILNYSQDFKSNLVWPDLCSY
jgi:hypothetical protein